MLFIEFNSKNKIWISWDNIRKEISISLINPVDWYLNRAVITFYFSYLTTFCFPDN